MARAKRNRQQRHADLGRIHAWRLEGWSERAIAAEMGLSPSTVHRDIAEIEQRWLEAIADNAETSKRLMMARWNHLLKEAWRQMRASAKARKGVADPRWGQRIAEILVEQGKILGVYSSIDVTLNVNRYLTGVAEELGIDAADLIDEAERVLEQALLEQRHGSM